MNANRTHRLTIVDRQYKVRQITAAPSMKNTKAIRRDNLIEISSRKQNKAA